MLDIVTTKVFDKDYKLLKKRGYNLNLIKEVIEILADEKELPQKYKNHQLIFIVDKPKSIYLHHTISHIHYISNT